MGKAVGIAAVTTDPQWPVDSSSTCWEAPVKDQLNGTGYYVQDITYGYGSDFRSIGLFHPIGTALASSTPAARAGSSARRTCRSTRCSHTPTSARSPSVSRSCPAASAAPPPVYPGDNGFVPAITHVSYNATDPNRIWSSAR